MTPTEQQVQAAKDLLEADRRLTSRWGWTDNERYKSVANLLAQREAEAKAQGRAEAFNLLIDIHNNLLPEAFECLVAGNDPSFGQNMRKKISEIIESDIRALNEKDG